MNKIKRPLKFIWNSFKWHKKMFYIFFIWKVIEWIFYVFFPILAKLEMDQLVEKNKELFWIIKLDSFSIFIVILLIIFWFKLLENILKSFIELFEFDYIKMYDNYHSESLYKRLEWVNPWFFLNSRNKRFIWDIISNIFVVLGIFTVLALLNIWIFVVLVIVSIIFYNIEKIKEKIKEKQKFEEEFEYRDKIWILTDQMRNHLSYLVWTGWFSMVFWYFEKYNDILRKRIKKVEKQNLILNLISFGVENISDILLKLIVWYGIFFATTSIWTMTMVLLYTSRINGFLDFIRWLRFIFNSFYDRLLKLDLFLDLTQVKKNKKLFIKTFNKIECKNLSFAYPNFAKEELKYLEIIENRIKSYNTNDTYDKDQLHLIEEAKKEAKVRNMNILDNISLRFEVWKTYWLVWKNWAWKTTFIFLLMNYFDNYSWNLLIDNNEIKNIDKWFFTKNISVVNQEPYIIKWFTIRENLLLWVDKNYSDKFIFSLLEKFWLKDKVLKTRVWLDSKIWYDNNFSGWEKQLIALIRVILQDKKILIMDEWTNQLDAENEILVMNELLKNSKDKIVIFITHRMTTIRKVDLIYCLENWKIISKWTHKELIWWKNIYSNFWKKQVEE